MAYTKQDWRDGAAGGTPIDAAALGHIEQGIEDAAATADGKADVAHTHTIADVAGLEARIAALEADVAALQGAGA